MTSTKPHSSSHSCLLRRIAVIALFFAASFAGQLRAQNFEGKKISSVGIRYNGPCTVDEAKIRGHMSTKAGQLYSASRLDDDVRSLYEIGLVDDIRFFAELLGAGVKVIAEVKTRAKIVAVGFIGNTKFSDKKLASMTPLKAGGVMSDQAILTARRNVQDHYRGFGYADVRVAHRIQSSEVAGTAELVLIIDEGARAEVRKIRFEGNASFPSHVLRNEMKTKQKGRIDNFKLAEDIDSIHDYYHNKGYLQASLGIRRAPVGDGFVDLVITIHEGQLYKVDEVSFGPMSVFKPEELYPSMTQNGKEAFSAKKMRDDIHTIRRLYRERGYADAVVMLAINNTDSNRLNIEYQITEGPVLRGGRGNVHGDE